LQYYLFHLKRRLQIAAANKRNSIIKVWVEKSLQMKSKKVELILPKSVKMELLKNLKRRKNML